MKIAGKELEKAIAGLNVVVAYNKDEVELCEEEVARDLRSALSSIRLSERGVYVQASTLGSLEALLEFLKTSSIPVREFNCRILVDVPDIRCCHRPVFQEAVMYYSYSP